MELVYTSRPMMLDTRKSGTDATKEGQYGVSAATCDVELVGPTEPSGQSQRIEGVLVRMLLYKADP